MIVEYKISIKQKLIDFLNKFHISKTNINRLINTNAISTASRIITNALDEIEGSIYINYSAIEDNSHIDSYNFPISIIYEDDNFIAIDKTKPMLVHSDGNTKDTLLNALTYYLKEKYDDSFIRPIHRIDYDTMGVVVFSKNILAQSYVTYLLENNLVTKKYLAICQGIIKEDMTLNLKIAKDRHNSKKYCVSKTGKEAITKIKVIKNISNNTLIECDLKTGRPHQIRVSLAYINHPIVGDNLYSNATGNLKLLSKEFSFNYLGQAIRILSKKDM